MPLSNMDQPLENAFEASLFLPLIETRVYGEHPVFFDNKFFTVGHHVLKIIHHVAGGQEDNNDFGSILTLI